DPVSRARPPDAAPVRRPPEGGLPGDPAAGRARRRREHAVRPAGRPAARAGARLPAPAPRPQALLLEEREMDPRPRAPRPPPARPLGALRLQQRRRPLEGRALQRVTPQAESSPLGDTIPSRNATAAASVRRLTPSLPRMFDTWTPAVLSLMNSVSAIGRLERPSARSASTSSSRRVNGDASSGAPDTDEGPRSTRARAARPSIASSSGAATGVTTLRFAHRRSPAASPRRPPAESRASARRAPAYAASNIRSIDAQASAARAQASGSLDPAARDASASAD